MNLIITVVLLLLCITTIFAAIKGKNEYESIGVVLLDSVTFHKVVPNHNYAVVVIVVNKADIGIIIYFYIKYYLFIKNNYY
jgi:hypothetical protein